ncbi:glutamate 5-kinase, partial [Acetobacter peroxydans]
MRDATRPSLAHAKRLVIKIGSALVVDPEQAAPRQAWLASVAEDIAMLRRQGTAVSVVSSGAIALARHSLGLTDRALRLPEKQAAAAVGQIKLAQAWSNALSAQGLTAAQLLLTPDDTEDRRRYLNARATLTTLLDLGCIPVINENDTIATTEIRFGDNDRLAARVAQMTEADQLILLSDIDGLYTADPRTNPAARHLPVIESLTP